MDFYSLAWFFLIYAFIGWSLEIIYAAVCRGEFVNRGFLGGPVCPIYGFGALIIELLLSRFADRIMILFICSVLLTSLLELVTGFVLEKYFHTKWWDYSGVPMNIGGYICPKFSLLWGVACVFLVKVLHPMVAAFLYRMPRGIFTVLLILCLSLLVADTVITLISLSELRRIFANIEDVRRIMRLTSDRIGRTLSDETVEIMEKNADVLKRLGAKYEKVGEHLTVRRSEILSALERIRASSAPSRRILRAFPHISDKYRSWRSDHIQFTDKLKKPGGKERDENGGDA